MLIAVSLFGIRHQLMGDPNERFLLLHSKVDWLLKIKLKTGVCRFKLW
jgi:hypothetical protein